MHTYRAQIEHSEVTAMEHSLETIAKEAIRGNTNQAKVILVALAVYEIFCIGKKAVELLKDIKV